MTLVLAKRFGQRVNIRDLTHTTRGSDAQRPEYIVRSHASELELLKLRDGKRGKGSDSYATGDTSPLRNMPDASKYDADGKLSPEIRHHIAMTELFHDAGNRLTATVGGFMAGRTCGHTGHRYVEQSAVITWDESLWRSG